MLLRADPRQHQELRRVHGTTAQNDLASGACLVMAPAAPERDADGATPFEQDLFAQRLGHDLQIASLHRRTQIADRGRAAASVARRRLVIADAVLARAVEITVARKAEPYRGVDERFSDRVI